MGNVLFLHLLSSFDFGKSDERLSGIDRRRRLMSTFETKALKEAIDAFPEALRLVDSEGYYPLHLICRHYEVKPGGERSYQPWNLARTDAFKLVLAAAQEIALERVHSNGNTALHCLAQARHGFRENNRKLDCFEML